MIRHETRVKALAGTLAALVLALVAGWVFDPARRLERAESARLLPAGKASVASISIGGTAPVRLEREGAAWSLLRGAERLPVESSRVDAFLEALARIARLSPVADTKAAWEGYGLAEGAARSLVLADSGGRELVSLAVGGYGSTGREVYVRRARSEASFAVDAGFVSWLDYAPSGWLDLRILPGAGGAEAVQAVSTEGSLALDGIGKPARRLGWSLARGEGGWTAKPALPVDAVAAESLVRALLNLQGEDIAPAGTAFGKVAASARLDLADGTSRVVEVGGAAGEGRYLVRLAGSERAWPVSVYALGNVFRELASLAPAK